MPNRVLSALSDVFWCRSCGIVWASDEAPLCRHGVIDPPCPPARMEPLPTWHPYAREAV